MVQDKRRDAGDGQVPSPQETASRPRRYLRVIAWIALSLALLVALDIAFTLAIEPYGSHSEAIWYEYRELTAAGERYDTIVIGSSVAQDGLQPGPLDEIGFVYFTAER